MIRFLGSSKLTIALCLILSAGGIAGSLLYHGNTAYGKISAFNIFRSPLFLLPAALLALNILFCAIPRLRETPASKPRTWTFAGLHLGVVLLGAGLVGDGLFGFVGTQYFPVGESYSGYHDWRTGKDEALPFRVQVLSGEVRHHPLNLKVGVKDAAGNKVGLFVVREGVPFSVGERKVVVTPRRYEIARKTLWFDAAVGERSVKGLAATPDAPASVDGYAVVPVAYFNPEPSGYHARVRFSAPGRASEEQDLGINDPGRFGGITFCIVDVHRDPYGNTVVGLQMTREPGSPLFWSGALLFCASLLGHLFLKRGVAVPAGAAGAAACLLFAVSPSPSFASGIVIDRDATWSGEVRVTAPVSVEKGATLRILPGTVVLLSGEDRDGDGCEDGYLQVFGELRVEGEPGRPVRFARLHPGFPWREIFLKDARAAIRNAVIEGAVWGLHIHDGEARVEESVIRGNGGGARMKGKGVTILRSEIRDNGIGIRFWEGGPAVSSSVIEGNGTGLFYRDGTGGGKIRGNRIFNREWDVKVGEWASGDLDLTGNFWGDGAPGHPRVRDYRERKDAGRISLEGALSAPPAGTGARAAEGGR